MATILQNHPRYDGVHDLDDAVRRTIDNVWLDIGKAVNPILENFGAVAISHATRLADYPAFDRLTHMIAWETDRTILYGVQIISNANDWVYLAGNQVGNTAAQPADLGTLDAGYTFINTETGTVEYWTGSAWQDQDSGTTYHNSPWRKVVATGVHELKDETGLGEVAIRAFDSANFADLHLTTGRGTPASPTPIQNDEVIGRLGFVGQLESGVGDTALAALIRAVAGGNWSVGVGSAGDWGSAPFGGAGTGWTITGWCRDTVEIGTDIYVGTSGESTGLGNVYKWNGSVWAKIGGGGTKSSWADQEFYGVMAMATDGTDLYVALGDQTPNVGGAEVWHFSVSGDTWTKIGDHSFGWPANTFYSCLFLLYSGGTLYAGLHDSGAHDGALVSYNGTPGSWTTIIDDPMNDLPGSLFFQSAIGSFAVDGTTMYIGTRCDGGTIYGSRVFSATIGVWTWTEIGGNSTNSSWSNTTVADVDVYVLGGILYAYFKPNSGQWTLWEWNGSTWAQIAGNGTNASWNSNANAAAVRDDGGLEIDTAYLYVHASADLGATGQGVWRRLLTGGNWEHIAGNANNNSWDDSDATSGGFLHVWSGFLYATIGGSAKSAEVWRVGVATPEQSAYLEAYVTVPGDTSVTLSQRWFKSLDVGIGGADVDGIRYLHDSRHVGFNTATPVRTGDFQGDDGIRINPSAQPSTPGAGDQVIHSAATPTNWLEWYDGTVWRFAMSGPASAVDGNLAGYDGTSGRVLQDLGTPADVVAGAGAYTALQEFDAGDPPDFILDPADDSIIYVWEDL